MPNVVGLSTFPIPMPAMASTRTFMGFAAGQKFTDSLKIRCRKYCGTVGREFVRKAGARPCSRRRLRCLKLFLKHERARLSEGNQGQGQARI